MNPESKWRALMRAFQNLDREMLRSDLLCEVVGGPRDGEVIDGRGTIIRDDCLLTDSGAWACGSHVYERSGRRYLYRGVER